MKHAYVVVCCAGGDSAVVTMKMLLPVIAQAAMVALVLAVATGGDVVPQPLCGVRTESSSYALGQPATITFIVENPTKQDMVLRFSSGKQFDMWALKDGAEVWRWSHGMVFTQALISTTLKPGERKTFEQTWKQVDNDGNQVAPGTYDLFAQLTTTQPKTTPVKYQITVGKGAPAVRLATVEQIVNGIASYVGQTVSLSGTYRGWRSDASGPGCRPGPPTSRSDWAISDSTGCMFATGDSHLDPTADYGKKISVIGVVKKTAKNQPYIEVKTVTVVK